MQGELGKIEGEMDEEEFTGEVTAKDILFLYCLFFGVLFFVVLSLTGLVIVLHYIWELL